MTLAAIMSDTSSTMPTAVITESSENTMSMSMICDDDRGERARRLSRAVPSPCSSPSSLPWISNVAFADQKQTADDQNQIAARDAVSEHREQRLRELDDPRDAQQQQHPRPERADESELARPRLERGAGSVPAESR